MQKLWRKLSPARPNSTLRKWCLHTRARREERLRSASCPASSIPTEWLSARPRCSAVKISGMLFPPSIDSYSPGSFLFDRLNIWTYSIFFFLLPTKSQPYTNQCSAIALEAKASFSTAYPLPLPMPFLDKKSEPLLPLQPLLPTYQANIFFTSPAMPKSFLLYTLHHVCMRNMCFFQQ